MPLSWFTSDLHFGHKNILNYCSRPWAADTRNPTKAETLAMDEALIANWNAVVDKDDDVYNLGDVAHCTTPKHAAEVLWSLNGRHHVIRGNHDALCDKMFLMYPDLFASYRPHPSYSDANVPGYLETNIEGQTIVMSHYAIREWHHALRGVWHIFGHTHAELKPFGKSCDVGVDNASVIVPGAFYRPISFDELKAFMDRQRIGPHPAFEHYRPGHPEITNLQVRK